MRWILFIIGTVFGLILLGLFCGIGYDAYLFLKYGTGSVKQGVHTTWVKEIIKEEDGCVYYIDVYDNQGKTCGSYEITHY